MKRGTVEHPKMLDLAEAIDAFLTEIGVNLGFEMSHTQACGIMERLWHYTARYSPAGDVGKHTDVRIARAVGWSHDASWLCAALVKVGFMDALDDCRLYVHDWHQHSDDAADKWLRDKDLRYANGEMPRRRDDRKTVSRDKSRLSRNKSRPSRDKSSQSEPEPEPKPEPSSEPSSKPKPEPEPSSADAPGNGLVGVLDSVSEDDLRSLPKLLAWYERQAAKPRPLIGKSDASRLFVVAASVRALECGKENPPGLFISLFEKERRSYITNGQEEKARRMLRDFDAKNRKATGAVSIKDLIGMTK